MNEADKAEALKDLKILNGDRPYNGGGNICQGDGYFAASIVRKYGMTLDKLAKAVGYKSDNALASEMRKANKTLEQENAELRIQLERIKSKGRLVDIIDVSK